MTDYRGFRIQRLIGSKMGRRGGAARRFGFRVTEPDGTVHVFPPTTYGGVTLPFVRQLIDHMIALKAKYQGGQS